MQNFEIKNVDYHATLAMIEKRWGFPRRTLRPLLGMTKNAQSGRSMIEMLGVLAIIGVLSVGGIAGYSKAMQKYRINKTIEQITQISQNIRTFFASQKNYSDLSNTVINKAKLIPDEMIDGNSYQSAFGGVIIDSQSSYHQGKTFQLKFSSIPQDACIELVSLDWSSVSSGFVGIATMNSLSQNCWEHSDYKSCSDRVSQNNDDTNYYSEVYVGGTIGIPVPIDKSTMMCGTKNYIYFLFK